MVAAGQLGLVGWSEATLEWHTCGGVGVIEDLQLFVGAVPRPGSSIFGR